MESLRGKEATSHLGLGTTDNFARETSCPSAMETVMLRFGNIELDTEFLPCVKKRRNKSLELSEGMVGRKSRYHGEA